MDSVKPSNCSQCPFIAYHLPSLHAHEPIHILKSSKSKLTESQGTKAPDHSSVVRKHDQEEAVCTQCDFHTSSNSLMRSHQKNSHGVPYDFVCETCGRDFKSGSHLKRHQMSHSAKETKSCGLCSNKTLKHVANHWKSNHKNVTLDLKCQNCDFEAIKLAQIETHMRDSHGDGAKEISCGKCDFSAFHAPTVASHIKSVHDLDLKCQLCSYEGSTTKGLRCHIEVAHIRKMKKH